MKSEWIMLVRQEDWSCMRFYFWFCVRIIAVMTCAVPAYSKRDGLKADSKNNERKVVELEVR